LPLTNPPFNSSIPDRVDLPQHTNNSLVTFNTLSLDAPRHFESSASNWTFLVKTDMGSVCLLFSQTGRLLSARWHKLAKMDNVCWGSKFCLV